MNYEMLLEKKLTTDFTMGFELEAIWNGWERHEDIESFFDDEFVPGGDVHDDESLLSDDESDTTFEYSSPVLPVNLATFNKIIDFYYNYYGEKFYVNDSCGYHHHISYPGITADDVVWIMSKLSLDENMKNKLKRFKQYDFETGWSKTEYLENLKSAVENFDFNNIIKYCNTAKYSLINVHSQKTLEWRGPRGFLSGGDTQTIKEFYMTLWGFINWITEVLDENEINGMDKDNFIEQVRIASKANNSSGIKNFQLTKSKDSKGLMSEETLKRIVDEIINNPKALLKFTNSPIPLEQIIQRLYNRDRLGKRIYQLNQEYDAQTLTKINNICYKYIPYRMLVQFGDRIGEDAKYKTSELTFKRLINTSKLDGQSVTKSDIGKLLVDNYKSFNQSLFSTKLYIDLFDNGNFVSAIAQKDTDMEFLRTIQPSVNQLTPMAISHIVEQYLNSHDYSTSVIKTLIQMFNSGDMLKDIYKQLYKGVLDHLNILPLLTFNEKSLWLLISRAKIKFDSYKFYDTFKPLLISNGKISEEEFDKIDREITQRATLNRIDVTPIEDEYDNEEISF